MVYYFTVSNLLKVCVFFWELILQEKFHLQQIVLFLGWICCIFPTVKKYILCLVKIKLKKKQNRKNSNTICNIHIQCRQANESWAFSSHVAPPLVWLSEHVKPCQTLGQSCSKCTNCVFIRFALVAWYGVYYNSEIHSLQECVA